MTLALPPIRSRQSSPAPARKKGQSPVVPRRVLVPVDFSAPSRKALRYALKLGQQFGSEVVAVAVAEPMTVQSDWVFPLTSEVLAEEREATIDRLRALVAKYEGKKDAVVCIGRAWQEIVKVAERRNCDLIVIATHGYTGFKHAMLGSVTEKVVRYAPCAVLVFRGERGKTRRRRRP